MEREKENAARVFFFKWALRKVFFLVGWPSPIENIPTPCGTAQGPRSCRAVVNSRTSTRSSRSGGQSPVGSVGVDLSVLESRDWWAILRFERGTCTRDTQRLMLIIVDLYMFILQMQMFHDVPTHGT
jgi:hypothetical protein